MFMIIKVTCCGQKIDDQNLEILVENIGDELLVIPSYFDLEGREGCKRFRALIPFPEQEIRPGEIKAFYCQMDDFLWQSAKRLLMYDSLKNQYNPLCNKILCLFQSRNTHPIAPKSLLRKSQMIVLQIGIAWVTLP